MGRASQKAFDGFKLLEAVVLGGPSRERRERKPILAAVRRCVSSCGARKQVFKPFQGARAPSSSLWACALRGLGRSGRAIEMTFLFVFPSSTSFFCLRSNHDIVSELSHKGKYLKGR